MLKPYLKKIFQVAQQGDAREESYYSTLEGLLDEYAKSAGKKNVHITTLPKKTEAGNPDFRVWDGKQHITGYIEAKAPENVDLDTTEDTEQLTRYRRTFPNLILTNFLEFRLYRDGHLIDNVVIGRPFVLHQLKKQPPAEKESEFLNLLEKFFSYSFPRLYDAKKLAVELAKRTRFLRDEVVAEQLTEEEQTGRHFIYGFYEAFKKYLIAGLNTEGFADLYSQTITYGLFAARTRSSEQFNRKLAYDNIPHTIGILRDVFRFISLEDLPQQMEWILDDISEVLAVTDVKQILHRFFHEGKGRDPIVHFYETFLAEYDPGTRERRGVYYTPEAVVSYIVRSLHAILKEHFGMQDGLAADSVTVLDPAAGTLTFLAEAAKHAVDEFVSKYGEGGRSDFIKEHILKNFYAFELMMAPYAVGHLKMSFLLEELGYKLHEDDRFKLYLTNTLEMEELAQTELPGMASLSEESHLAGEVKKQIPILVILGNPPYSGISANASVREVTVKKGQNYKAGYQIERDEATGRYELLPDVKKARRNTTKRQKTWIGELIEQYKVVDGKWLKEKNPKWLQDDYVKFIRFAQWKIEKAGKGAIGLITNHAYLDNPTFRGMRQSLMDSFDEIYVLDLHGSSLKRERCPDGSKDENVFDIRQGVAIALFMKGRPASASGISKCEVHHSEIWGLRKKKYRWLVDNAIQTTEWQKVDPKAPFYLFVRRDERLWEAYDSYPCITDIFRVGSVGLFTARDGLTIKWRPADVWSTVLHFSKIDSESARKTYDLGKDVRDWKVELAQRDLKETGPARRRIVPILYRPFDTRYTYYTGKSRGFHCMPRQQIMRHMMRPNLALCVGRAGHVVGQEVPWNLAFCSGSIIDLNLFYRGGSMNFPLYLYPKLSIEDLFTDGNQRGGKVPNIKSGLFKTLGQVYANEVTSEQILQYIYGVLYADAYRRKYAEFLRIDYPRIPFTKNHRLFRKLAESGKRLLDLHLLRSRELGPPISRFQGAGDKNIEKVKFDRDRERVYINQTRYFDGVREQVWLHQIGGYQVCNKSLKDRKDRELSVAEIKQYCRIVTALQKTIEVQKSIDEIYPEVEKQTIEFDLD